MPKENWQRRRCGAGCRQWGKKRFFVHSSLISTSVGSFSDVSPPMAMNEKKRIFSRIFNIRGEKLGIRYLRAVTEMAMLGCGNVRCLELQSTQPQPQGTISEFCLRAPLFFLCRKRHERERRFHGFRLDGGLGCRRPPIAKISIKVLV